METHPEWLRPSKIFLTIVCGPPCGGKTTYVNQHKAPGDTVIDLDAICRKLRPSYRHWARPQMDSSLLKRALRVRNIMLGRLSVATSGQAWFIVAAPSEGEREWWKAKLGGEVVLLNPGFQECRRRALARGTPLAIAGIETWEIKSDRPWHAPVYRPAIGADGWFAEDDEVATNDERRKFR